MTSRRVRTLLVVATAVEIALFVRPPLPLPHPAARLLADLALQSVLLMGVPAALARLLWRAPLSQFGLTLGRVRDWRAPVAALIAVAVPMALLATRLPSIHAAYPVLVEARARPLLLIPSALAFAAYGLTWELFFRGFVTLGLRPAIGAWAIAAQAVPCALLHAGKPGVELLAAVPGALLLGAMAYRTRSIVPGWIVHVSVALAVNLGAVFWPL